MSKENSIACIQVNEEANGGESIILYSKKNERGYRNLEIHLQCYGEHSSTIDVSCIESFESLADELCKKIELLTKEADVEVQSIIHDNMAVNTILRYDSHNGSVAMEIILNGETKLASVYLGDFYILREAILRMKEEIVRTDLV